MKSWGRAVVSAFWFATVMAAAQVGTASILGVLRLGGTFDDTDAWTARLTLLSWFALSSAVAGAYAGSRGGGSGIRVAASFAAGLGGALGGSVALYPARTAALPQGDAQLTAGIALGLAAATGFILAFGVLSARSLAWNATVTALFVWALLAVSLATHPDEVRLGQLDAPGMSRSFLHGFSLWGLPLMTALLSLCTALVARLRGHHRGAVALSGLAGPATIALAYAIAGPGATDAQKIPWTSALAAVIAGLAASLFVALPPRRTHSETDVSATAPDTPKAAAETEWASDSAFPLPPAQPLSDTMSDTLTDTLAEGRHRRSFADLDDRSIVPRPLG